MEHQYKETYKPLDLNPIKEDDFILVSCPKCDCSIPAKNIELSNKIAKCDECNAVFSVNHKIVALQEKDSAEIIPKPVGIDILEFNDALELTLPQPLSTLYTILASASPFFIFIFLAIFFKKDISWAIYPSLVSIFSFVFSTIKLIMARKDRIYITVDHEELIIEYRPTNFISDQVYYTKNIEQLFVKRDAHGLHLSMLLNEIDGQRSQKLVGRFSDITKAKYVEQEIERYLDIKNKKVPGEVL